MDEVERGKASMPLRRRRRRRRRRLSGSPPKVTMPHGTGFNFKAISEPPALTPLRKCQLIKMGYLASKSVIYYPSPHIKQSTTLHLCYFSRMIGGCFKIKVVPHGGYGHLCSPPTYEMKDWGKALQ